MFPMLGSQCQCTVDTWRAQKAFNISNASSQCQCSHNKYKERESEKPDHIHKKVQQKQERGRQTEKKKKIKKEEEEEEEAVASWRHPYFVVVFFLFSFSVCFFFFFRVRFNGKQGTVRSGMITVLRTVRSDRGSHGSMLFSHRAVLEAKRTAKMNGSRFFWSDRTVRSGFQNLVYKEPTSNLYYLISSTKKTLLQAQRIIQNFPKAKIHSTVDTLIALGLNTQN